MLYNTIQYILLTLSIGFLGNQFPCTRKIEKISRCVENSNDVIVFTILQNDIIKQSADWTIKTERN